MQIATDVKKDNVRLQNVQAVAPVIILALRDSGGR